VELNRRSGTDAAEILDRLEEMGSEKNVAGMARFGIVGDRPFGVSVVELRKLAREIAPKKDHSLALALWKTKRHEARLLATLVDDPARVTEAQMARWARDLRSWDVCDACAMNLFDKTRFAWRKAKEFARHDEEFVKRCGFAMMAALASHDKQASDERFAPFLSLVEREAWDERKYVKKGVNWALRGIGKRNARLRKAALLTARQVAHQGTPSARWIARDAIKELQSR